MPSGFRAQLALWLKKSRALFAIVLVLAFSTTALSDDRTIIRPAFNIFSPQQDVEIGERAAAAVPRQYPLLNNKRVDDYFQEVGMRLIAHVPKGIYPYPYKYRCVNAAQVNAFALPGGFIYINRGVIENADNEAQLAGVMAHETAHVVLRHGTAQATKSAGARVALGIVGAFVGGNLAASLITQLFSSAAVPLVFLKMSRTDESQADILGTQILHDAGYDPEGMGDFFKKLDSSAQPPQFFSDHPNPANRIQRIGEEVDRSADRCQTRRTTPRNSIASSVTSNRFRLRRSFSRASRARLEAARLNLHPRHISRTRENSSALCTRIIGSRKRNRTVEFFFLRRAAWFNPCEVIPASLTA